MKIENNEQSHGSEHHHGKDIKYLMLEQPVLVIDLEGASSNTAAALLSSISKAAAQMASIGIHNIVLKSNDAKLISAFLKEVSCIRNMNFNVRMNFEGIKNLLADIDGINAKYSLSCCINEASEIEDHIGELSQNTPIILRASNNNSSYLMNNITAVSDKYSNMLIVSAELDMNENKDNCISWESLDMLYCNIIDLLRENPNKKILMDYGILPTRLLTEHPCNGYVCSHHTCHSEKNNLPRRLYINGNGDVIPEHINIKSEYYIGNILEKDFICIMEEYKDSDKHQEFLDLAKKVYTKWVQVCPYRVVHLSDLMMRMS